MYINTRTHYARIMHKNQATHEHIMLELCTKIKAHMNLGVCTLSLCILSMNKSECTEQSQTVEKEIYISNIIHINHTG